jgi:acrylyl-CoA reductase (NADPH)
LVKTWPHVPGIDFAGTVETSDEDRYRPGDRVILTGWHVGERHWGGYATKARVKADWLVPLPEGLSGRQAMAIGTAGLTAMFAVMALEEHGLAPGAGEVLVTGAAGGVGSVAVALLAALGHEVAAVTGRPETEPYLRNLGAARIVPRAELAETVKRPLESETWAGCIDAVGGAMLARVLGQMKYRTSVAAVGNAGGVAVPATVIPFLLRGVNLLGIDSVLRPYDDRVRAWERLASDLPMVKLEEMIRPARLEDLPELGRAILKGQVQGRVVVDTRA